jgi:hypothetical protein
MDQIDNAVIPDWPRGVRNQRVGLTVGLLVLFVQRPRIAFLSIGRRSQTFEELGPQVVRTYQRAIH